MGYIISLGVGFAVGIIYWVLKVQSPAPPLIALAGLLGMVLGEHAIPLVKAQFLAQSTLVQVARQDASLLDSKLPKPRKNSDDS